MSDERMADDMTLAHNARLTAIEEAARECERLENLARGYASTCCDEAQGIAATHRGYAYHNAACAIRALVAVQQTQKQEGT